ncbi:MAG: excinuclease ABC subunit UvrB [Patescibacteria group bacterium]
MKFKLESQFKPEGDQPQAIKKLVKGLEKKDRDQTLLGVTGSGKTFTMANIIEQQQKPTLIISHNKTLAAQLASEFREFFPKNAVNYFVSYYDYYQPEAYIAKTDTYIEKETDINEEIDRLRHASTHALMTRNDVIVVASVSCIYGLGTPELYKNISYEVKRGGKYNRAEFFKRLVAIQYRRNDVNLVRGTFRVQGETVELFPSFSEHSIYQIRFFGDAIEKIIEMDYLTREPIQEWPSLLIFPASHYIMPPDYQAQAFANIRADMKTQVAKFKKQNKLIEAQRLEQKVTYDLEMLEATGFVNGIENYSRYFDGRQPGEPSSTLINYFPDDFLMFIDESHITVPQIGGMYNGDQARKQTLIDHGFRLPSAKDNRPLKFEEFDNLINQVIYVSATPREYELKKSKQVAEQLIRPTGLLDPKIKIKPTRGQLKHLVKEIEARIANGQRALVTTLTKKLAEELTDHLKDQGIAVQYLHSDIKTFERLEILRDLRTGVFDVVVGINLLREGLDLPEVSLVAILDADKESFLRDEISLVQTIGRAARHQDGQVIMYADKISGSMKRAISETERRRKTQTAYNKKHGLTPKSIQKAIKDERLSGAKEKSLEEEYDIDLDKVKELTREEVKSFIKDMNEEMKLAANNLEFEKAAIIRDNVNKLKKL